ncbi:MAG: phosphoribosyltransferase, partial [Deltaproteobacteria bacterium]|nr:phosphoribosyltransferase [Deltaproteobacteria bacterium]
MSGNPYDYENRTGIHPVSWEGFHSLCKGLVIAISRFRPGIVLPIGRAGYYPGTLIAHMLQVELYPVRLSRRVKDIVTYQSPQWLVKPPMAVQNRRVLIVDEICSTGETITMVKQKVEAMGARAVKSAVLYAHAEGAPVPDYVGLITDALILNPWDREVFREGTFQFHPEYVEALAQQGVEADGSLLIDAPVMEIAKGQGSRLAPQPGSAWSSSARTTPGLFVKDAARVEMETPTVRYESVAENADSKSVSIAMNSH